MLMLAFALVISLYIVRYLYAEFCIETSREASYRLRAQGSLPLAVLTGLQGWLAYSTGLVSAAYVLWFCTICWSVVFIISVVILINYARQRRLDPQK